MARATTIDRPPAPRGLRHTATMVQPAVEVDLGSSVRAGGSPCLRVSTSPQDSEGSMRPFAPLPLRTRRAPHQHAGAGRGPSTMRLLVIEDSDRLRRSLIDGLQASGYAVDACPDGRDGLLQARAIEYDLILLDLMLPEVDGLTLLRDYRRTGRRTPILILSARDRVDHRIEGQRAGADDYLVKPFDFGELLARIEALARRARGIDQNVVSLGPLRLDLGAKCFSLGNQTLDFTPREYAVLEYLVINAGRVVPRAEIEEHIYSADRPVWSNAVDSAIAAIRRKLHERGIDGLVQTRRRQGYIAIREAADSAFPGRAGSSRDPRSGPCHR